MEAIPASQPGPDQHGQQNTPNHISQPPLLLPRGRMAMGAGTSFRISVPPGKGDAAGTRLLLRSVQHPCGKGLGDKTMSAWSPLYRGGGCWAARCSVEESRAMPACPLSG